MVKCRMGHSAGACYDFVAAGLRTRLGKVCATTAFRMAEQRRSRLLLVLRVPA
jgi:hypothetical protein